MYVHVHVGQHFSICVFVFSLCCLSVCVELTNVHVLHHLHVCTCVDDNVRTHMHTHTHTYAHTHTHTLTHTHTCKRILTHMHACAYTHTHLIVHSYLMSSLKRTLYYFSTQGPDPVVDPNQLPKPSPEVVTEKVGGKEGGEIREGEEEKGKTDSPVKGVSSSLMSPPAGAAVMTSTGGGCGDQESSQSSCRTPEVDTRLAHPPGSSDVGQPDSRRDPGTANLPLEVVKSPMSIVPTCGNDSSCTAGEGREDPLADKEHTVAREPAESAFKAPSIPATTPIAADSNERGRSNCPEMETCTTSAPGQGASVAQEEDGIVFSAFQRGGSTTIAGDKQEVDVTFQNESRLGNSSPEVDALCGLMRTLKLKDREGKIEEGGSTAADAHLSVTFGSFPSDTQGSAHDEVSGPGGAQREQSQRLADSPTQVQASRQVIAAADRPSQKQSTCVEVRASDGCSHVDGFEFSRGKFTPEKQVGVLVDLHTHI